MAVPSLRGITKEAAQAVMSEEIKREAVPVIAKALDREVMRHAMRNHLIPSLIEDVLKRHNVT